MSQHLEESVITAAVAGLELDPGAREHLETCVHCRSRAAAMRRLIESRRGQMLIREPDWQAQRAAILGRLHSSAPRPARQAEGLVSIRAQRRWLRPLLAAAAVLMAATGLLVVNQPWQPVTSQAEVPVEQILAEVDAMLASETLPGFEALDSIVPNIEEIEAHYHQNGAS